MTGVRRSVALHLGAVAALAALFLLLPQYHAGNLARIMVLAVYAAGYNVLFGYTGLLSLGHALYFAAGMYGFGLAVQLADIPAGPALAVGVGVALLASLALGTLALRTRGVGFMIVTLMFAQAGYLLILHLGSFTRGDEGFVIPQARRALFGLDLTTDSGRYWAAFVLFSASLFGVAALVRSRLGLALVAIRENEERARMLGYDVQRLKLAAMLVSGGLSGIAGAAYALLFGYVGATFASVQYSIFPLLWTLLGGAGTTIGPLIGVAFMTYLIDVASLATDAYMLVVGATLLGLCLFAPRGIGGELRRRVARWLP